MLYSLMIYLKKGCKGNLMPLQRMASLTAMHSYLGKQAHLSGVGTNISILSRILHLSLKLTSSLCFIHINHNDAPTLYSNLLIPPTLSRHYKTSLASIILSVQIRAIKPISAASTLRSPSSEVLTHWSSQLLKSLVRQLQNSIRKYVLPKTTLIETKTNTGKER